MESMKRVASKSAKRTSSNPDGAAEDGEQQQEEKKKPKIKVRRNTQNRIRKLA